MKRWSSLPQLPESLIPSSASPSSIQLHSLSPPLPPPSFSSPEPEPEPSPPESLRYLDVKDSDMESNETLRALYECWMTHCEVFRSPEEKQKRFVAFKENVKFIHLENKTENYPYKLKLNKFSDMTNEEFESTHTEAKTANFKHLNIKDSDLQSDKTLQHLYNLWGTRYRVSRSPNEKLKRFAAFKKQVKLIHSENKKDNIYKLGLNQFSDMTREEFESKDMGASPAETLEMYGKIMEAGGIVSKKDYSEGKMDGPRVTFDGYHMITPNDEEALEEAGNKRCILAFIDCRGDAFKNYRGGVLTEDFGKDHEMILAVNIVGYGVTPYGVKYWEIDNGWGAKYGEGGFMRIKKGVNLRGIASFATFAVLNKPSFDAYCTRG